MKLHSGSAVAVGDATPVGGASRYQLRAVQVQLVGTSGSVKLQGRVASDAPWVDLGVAFTATGVQFLQLLPEVRANVTAVTDAVIDVWVDAQKT